jgi:mannose-6-phosphate isomerase-like protein (cupin superfamily)
LGKVIEFAAIETRPSDEGAVVAPFLDWFDGTEMMASLVRLAPDGRYEASVPRGSDQYLFVLSGAAQFAMGGVAAALAADDWLILEEGKSFALLGGAAEILSITVPPPGAGRASAGFRGGFKKMSLAALPVVDLPAEKKRRTYLANEALAAGSARGHAMIVGYTGATLTKMHHHPNAESLFVILSGRVRFTIDGAQRVLARGQAAFFPIDDSHGLKSADGNALSFLELHVPGAFRTVYDE